MTDHAKWFLVLAGVSVLILLCADRVLLSQSQASMRWGEGIEKEAEPPPEVPAGSWEYPMGTQTSAWGRSFYVPTNASVATNFILKDSTNQFGGDTNAFDRRLREQTNASDSIHLPIDALDRPGDARTNILEGVEGSFLP